MRQFWMVLALLWATACGMNAYADSLYVKGGSFVHHDKNNEKYVEGFDNNAIAVEYEFKETHDGHMVWSISAQHNTNSYGKESVSLYGAGKACTDAETRVCAGLAMGGVTGYEHKTGMPVTPFGGIVLSAEHGKVGVDVLIVPSIGKLTGFQAGILKYKVMEW